MSCNQGSNCGVIHKLISAYTARYKRLKFDIFFLEHDRSLYSIVL